MWIDSHCHLNMISDRAKAIEEARKAKVGVINNICTRVQDIASELALKEESVVLSAGIHPDNVTNLKEIEILKENINHLVGLGETGLDLYRGQTNLELQEQHFVEHINLAKQYSLPVIIHTRAAEEETIKLIKQELNKPGNFSGVFHCFTGSAKLARFAIDQGFYLSFSGIVTFKNASAIGDIAKTVPSNLIMIETDAPYLSPEPKRGVANVPAHVVFTGEFLSNLRQENNFAEITTRNFFQLFPKASAKEGRT